jgi:hypothetical protein
MSITHLLFKAVASKNLRETNDYKVHYLNFTNELTGKTIDDILDAITWILTGDIIEKFEIEEDKKQILIEKGM